MIDKEILDILCCPACKSDLKYTGKCLVCQGCGLKYSVEDGIPILIVEEAKQDANC